MENASSKIRNSYNSIKKNSTPLKIFIFFCIGLGSVMLLTYLVNKLKSSSLKSYTCIKTPIMPSKNNVNVIAYNNNLPNQTNGKEFAYSFWVYINSVNNTNTNSLILLRSPTTSDVEMDLKEANFVAYLSKGSNILKIKLRTLAADDSKVQIETSNGLDGKLLFNNAPKQKLDKNKNVVKNPDGSDKFITFDEDLCYYASFEISYVPLQRWVNIVVVSNDNIVAVYMDKTAIIARNLSNDNPCTSQLSSSLSPQTGNIFTGSSTIDNITAADCYLARLQYFNYEIGTSNIEAIYNAGPVSSSKLAAMGLPVYSVRSPFYRVDSIAPVQV